MQRQNIHVAARIRPLLELVSDVNERRAVRAVSPNIIRVDGMSDFVFDLAIGEDQDQVNVFESVGKHIVEGCIDGYNGTIFAYGQTGSGKTYTMVGPNSLCETMRQCPEKRGLIPRAAERMFLLLNERQDKEGDAFLFEVRCTFVQLYREKLYDLLSSRGGSENLEIHLDGHGNTVLTGAEERIVNTVSDLISIVDDGLTRRNVAETAMNTESSRSHAILTLTVKTTVSSCGGITVHKHSRLNLVDLAGSERQKDAMSSGERLKEASAINRSLLMLGRVIRALSDPDYKQGSYVAYRDSTLTLLLKDSLGGNAQTAVIVTVHSNKRFMEETVLTLRFAQQVKKVKNRIVVNEDLSGENVDAWKTEIHRLHEELIEARRTIEQLKLEAAEKCKVANKRSNEELQLRYEKDLDEKNQELKELKVRYARCIDSFELLRRYQQAPDEVFEAISEFMKRGDEQLENLKENWLSLCAEDIGVSQSQQLVKADGVLKENDRVTGLELELNEERVAHEVTKARYDAIRKRLSLNTTASQSFASVQESKTPAQIKKERRLTRFTMGTSSYNRRNKRPVFQPLEENENNDFEDLFEVSSDTDAAHWEEEKLRWECENNRLIQINEELQDQLLKLRSEKNDALSKFSERNDQLEEMIRKLENELSNLRNEKETSYEVWYNLKEANEKQSLQLSSLKNENATLSRRLDEFKEANEALEAENATLKIQTSDKERQKTQEGLKLLELQSRLDDLRHEITRQDNMLRTSEERIAAERRRADAAEKKLEIQKRVVANRDTRLLELETAQEKYSGEIDSKRLLLEDLRKQLEDALTKQEMDRTRSQELMHQKEEQYDKLLMKHQTLSDAAVKLFGTLHRRRSGFIDGLDALNEIARITEGKNKEIAMLANKVCTLEKDLEETKKDCDEAASCVDKLMHGDGTYRSKVQYINNLREEVYALRTRVNELEKENLEKGSQEGSKARMLTRSATARQKKGKKESDKSI